MTKNNKPWGRLETLISRVTELLNSSVQCSEKPQGIQRNKKVWPRDFPGGPLGKIPRSQCKGPGFNPWSGD